MMNKPMSISSLRNNCTLVAVKEVTGRSDEEIIDSFLSKRWKPHSGAHDGQYIGVIKDFGHKVESVSTRLEGRSWFTPRVNQWGETQEIWNPAQYMTLGQFISAHPLGVFVVRSNGHAWVVRDGRVVDDNFSKSRLGRRIKGAWKILDAPGGVRLTRRSVVEFRGASNRKAGSASFDREYLAVQYMRDHPWSITLDELLEKTLYTRSDAIWDFKRGRLRVVSDK